MKQIYDSRFQTIFFDEEASLFEFSWTDNSADMTSDEYQQAMLAYANQVERFKPLKVLVDTRNQQYIISTEMQEWTNQTILTRVLAAGLKRVAIVVPEDLIAHLSIEQAMTEEVGLQFETQYFDNDQKAREWLLSEPK